MKKVIVFVCHGNICRSTMAEFLFRRLLEQKGLDDRFEVFSRATSTEESGNPVHRGVRPILDRLGIDYSAKRAQRITRAECDRADLIVAMDHNNLRNLKPFLGENSHKVSLLLSFAGLDRGIADPWYTGDFDETYRDVSLGCEKLLEHLIEKENSFLGRWLP